LHISVKDICDTAEVGRTTFYAYYKDQFDLLRQIEEQSFTETALIMEKYGRTKKISNQEIISLFEDLLQYTADNRNSTQVLLSENGDVDFQKRIMHKCFEWLHRGWGLYSNEVPDAKTVGYYSVYWMSGALALIQKWLKDGMDTPVSDMANMLVRLMGGRG
jgi:AcrR family transcriptional regulator